MAAKIKKGDRVVVIAGKDRGTTGTVLRAMPKEDRLVVQGVRMMAKHVKPSQADPQGGIKRSEAPIHVSNVALVNAAGERVRVGFETRDGKKVRVAKGSGEVING